MGIKCGGARMQWIIYHYWFAHRHTQTYVHKHTHFIRLKLTAKTQTMAETNSRWRGERKALGNTHAKQKCNKGKVESRFNPTHTVTIFSHMCVWTLRDQLFMWIFISPNEKRGHYHATLWQYKSLFVFCSSLFGFYSLHIYCSVRALINTISSSAGGCFQPEKKDLINPLQRRSTAPTRGWLG